MKKRKKRVAKKSKMNFKGKDKLDWKFGWSKKDRLVPSASTTLPTDANGKFINHVENVLNEKPEKQKY